VLQIKEGQAQAALLTDEIGKLENEVSENTQALKTATNLREKEIAAFSAEEKDLLEAIGGLKAAIEVLSKHQSFVQFSSGAGGNLAETLERQMRIHADMFRGALSPSQQDTLSSFLQAPQDYFDATPTFKQAYGAQSGSIYGILTQMLETFDANLKGTQAAEQKKQSDYAGLKAAKEQQISEGQAQIQTKTGQLGDTKATIANNEQEKQDTEGTLSADELFLRKLKEHCSATDSEWEERQKARQLELDAVQKAIAVLNADEARDLFTRTLHPSFIQEGVVTHSSRRSDASEALMAASQRFHNPRLATLATQVRLDAFTKVKAAIDELIAQLLEDKKDEIQHRDFCTKETNANEQEHLETQNTAARVTETIQKLESDIAKLQEEIESLVARITDLQVQLKSASETRTKESKVFQATVADQQETQRLLSIAHGILAEVFEASPSMLQEPTSEPAGPPPPPGFKEYQQQDASGGVMKMIQQIIEDAKAMEIDALKDEQEAVEAMAQFTQETTTSIDTMTREMTNKRAVKGQKEVQVSAKETELESLKSTLTSLEQQSVDLHKACDFVVKNFDVRQTARDEEVEALRQVKAILSGSKFEVGPDVAP